PHKESGKQSRQKEERRQHSKPNSKDGPGQLESRAARFAELDHVGLRGCCAFSIVTPHLRPDNSPHMDWASFREHFPVTAHWAFFDHAAVAPPTADCARAITEWAEDKARNGATSYQVWDKRIDETRRRAGKLINADPLDVCFIGNTSQGVG